MLQNEWRKMLRVRTLFTLLLILLLNMLLHLLPVHHQRDYSVAAYRAYMTEFEGLTAEQAEPLISDAFSDLSNMQNDPHISDSELSQKQSALEHISEKNEAFFACEEFNPEHFFDLDWDALLAPGINYFFLIGLILVIIPFFSDDCLDMRQMLLSLKRGRSVLIRRKLLCACMFALVWMLLLHMEALIGFACRNSFHNGDMPVQSLDGWHTCRLSVSLLGAWSLRAAVQIAWSIPAALLTACCALLMRTATSSALSLTVFICFPFLTDELLPVSLKWILTGSVLNSNAIICSIEPYAAFLLTAVSWFLHLIVCSCICMRCWCRRNGSG